MQSVANTFANKSFQAVKPANAAQRRSAVVRASSSDLQKPVAKPVPVAEQPSAATSSSSQSSGVTIEYQRQQAKAMQQYFRDQKLEATVADAQVFGWTKKNEIRNGRWVMMGLAIGMLTEYATAVNFIDQLKLMVSYMGLADIYD